jgi:WD40 repeat protein
MITGVALSSDGKRAISASLDHTLKVWNLTSGQEIRTLEGHTSRVTAVAMSSDGRCAVSASIDTTLKVWNLETGQAINTLEGHSEALSAVALSPDMQRTVSVSYDGTLKMWDLRSAREIAAFICDGTALCCAFICDRRLVAGDASHCVYVLSLDKEAELPGQSAWRNWQTRWRKFRNRRFRLITCG